MNNHLQKLLFYAIAIFFGIAVNAQVLDVDYKKYPDANPFYKPQTHSASELMRNTGGVARSSSYGQERPDHVNNALTKYFPPVFSQDGGSCGSAQAVGYMLTEEMNAYRNTDASLAINQLPTHFTWLHTNSGVDKQLIMIKHGVPTVVDYGGRTYSEIFGNQVTSDPDFGYMQGYDKWYRAMFNRIVGYDVAFAGNQMTEIGREQLKQYLWNHMGDETFYAGGITGIGVAAFGNWGKVPETQTNRSLGVSGLYCVTSWGETFNHALTVAGYDDRIEFDLDSNGVYGEPGKDEMGAWIICNSWSSGWCNKGFIYCPYKYSVAVGISPGWAWNSSHYVWRKDYAPKRTFKILMDYDHRSEISIIAGVASDTSATKPEVKETMPFFRYAGNGSGSSDAPAVPMLGKWKGKMHYEPMEFGYDVTDLSEPYDMTKPLKYFLQIDSKSNAVGKGNIYKFCVKDYTLEDDGLEVPARIDTVAILNGGKTTIISVVVAGRQLNGPLNVTLDGTRLTWGEPMSSSYLLKSYYIYKGNEKVAEVPSISHSYTVDDADATYYVASAYTYKNKTLTSSKSEPARNAKIMSETDNNVLTLKDAATTIPNLLKESLQQATVEFWFKPTALNGPANQIGEAWGSFLFTTTTSGQLVCGWDENNRVTTSTNTVKTNTWYHVAIVVDNHNLTLYVNGMKKGSVISNDYSGIPALTKFCLGGTSGKFNSQIDELRIWKTARQQVQVYRNKGLAVANPAAQSDLVAYYPMTTYEKDGQTYVKDLASSYDFPIDNASTEINNSLLNGTAFATMAAFTFPSETVYTGEPVLFKSGSMINATSWSWNAPDAVSTTSNVINPYFVFKEPGTYAVTHSVTDVNGVTVDSTLNITVESPELPIADFDLSATSIAEGDIVSLANKSVGANCIYTWTLPGADQETLNCVNGAVMYNQTGTFPITLTATNSGGSSSKTAYITVAHSAPLVQFSVDPSQIMLGETTYLVDETKHNPSSWKWKVSNGVHHYIVNGQMSSLTPEAPGVYDVTLISSNDVGTDSTTVERQLIVTNGDSRNALVFDGGQELESTADFFGAGTKAFTIEWWMQPFAVTGSINFSTEKGQVDISTSMDGTMSVTVGGKTVNSGDAFVIANEWHHYAITFTFGTVKFYRDGVLVTTPSTRLGTSTTSWGKLYVSKSDNKFKGQIDELRIWSKALSLAQMKNFINAPISNVEEAESGSGLVAYYDFNQSGGSVKDRTSGNNDLTRIGFGPDGDAWGLSRGVFTLDFGNEITQEIEADGITSIYESVQAGKTKSVTGQKGYIRFACETAKEIRIYTLDGKCVFNDTVEGVHYLPFEPGIYIADGEKILVE